MNEVFIEKYGRGAGYASAGAPKAFLPTPKFLLGTCFGPLLWLWNKARQGKCDDVVWVKGSAWLADIFEGAGGKINVEGLDNLDKIGNGPCVFIANHMSALETFLLPGMIRPLMPVTFVVKKSLTTMPVFGPVMRSRDPVVVGRENPREDLTRVLEEGSARLARGISIVVFPQSTRSLKFEPAHFNSIGIKLALKADVPVLPIALNTAAWGPGWPIKEIARINPDLPARFRFGKPMRITGRGKQEHADICQFIGDTLAGWESGGEKHEQ